MKSLPKDTKKVSPDLTNEIDPQDNSRVTLSLGLIAAYIAVISFLGFPSLHPNSFANILKMVLTVAWGIPTFFLVIYIFLHAISLKYFDPNKIKLIGSKFRIRSSFKKVIFDTSVETYITGVITYSVYYVPWYLIERGMNQIYAFIIFFVLVFFLSFIFLVFEKRQRKVS